MSQERLTLQEISWLLAQEARGAARSLRQGVVQLKSASIVPAAEVQAPGLENNLDTLDDTIDMLSRLQSGGTTSARRGRIDLAALLYEIAPTARISIEPGAGTEVFGDETDLRRMLHVLVNQTNQDPTQGMSQSCSEVTIRRHGDMVQVSVILGPDRSATVEVERRWLSRMAVRHGGRLDLEGGTQSVFLPADGATDQRQVAELKRELVQAQQLGEAYARELATLVSSQDPSLAPEPEHGDQTGSIRFAVLRSAALATIRPLRQCLDALRGDTHSHTGAAAAYSETAMRSFRAGQELLSDWFALAEIEPEPVAGALDLNQAAKDIITNLEVHGTRLDVGIEVRGSVPPFSSGAPSAARLALRALVSQAIAATPRDGRVTIQLEQAQSRVRVVVSDDGPPVAAQSADDLAKHRIDPSSLGRPAGPGLLIAETAVALLGGFLGISQVAGRTAVTIELPNR